MTRKPRTPVRLICTICSKEYRGYETSLICSKECESIKRKRRVTLLKQTTNYNERTKLSREKYNQTEKGKLCLSKEQQKIYRRKYNQSEKGKEMARKRALRFYYNNKFKVISYGKIRHTLTKKEDAATNKDREQILIVNNYSCVFCGNKEQIECDHIIPISRGGQHTKDNLQPLCKTCNCRKNNRIISAPDWTD